MANLFLAQLLCAANKMERPRFACSLVLAMVAHSDEDGVVNATRDDLAEIVDRGEHQSRRAERLSRIKTRTAEHEAAVKELQTRLADGEISQDLYDQEVAGLTDRYRKYVRSPTLANVSNVISHFRKSRLMSVSYIDPETGEEFDTTARGRYAKYRFRVPEGQKLTLGDQNEHNDPRYQQGTVPRSAEPINNASTRPVRTNAKRGVNQLSLF